MKNSLFSFFAILLLGVGLFTGCIKDDFDEPPIDGTNPDITTNATIADVLAKWQPGQIVEIKDDMIFSGVVISSDEQGNFYKTLVLEDETGGIRFTINSTGLFNKFPLNRRVFVKAKGLFIGDYRDLPTIGAGKGTNNSGNAIIERIPDVLIEKYLFKGKKNEPSPIREKTIAEITIADVNRLIRIKDVEFEAGALGLAMAESSADANRTLVDCTTNTMDIRTSRYSDFADAAVPDKHGTVDAVVGIYSGGMQLAISKYEDIKMESDRCTGGGGGGGTGDWTLIGTSAIVDEVDENFDALSNGDDAIITGWVNGTDIANGRYWSGKTYQSDKYIQASAYNDNNSTTHSWIVTPGVTNFGSKKLSFRSAWGFGDLSTTLKVYVSTDFNGSDIAGATWTEINPTVAQVSDGEHAWVESGIFDLSAFSGTGYVAFEYTGESGSSPTSLRVDDVVINATGVSAGGGGGGPTLTQVGDWYMLGTSATVSSLNEHFDDVSNNDDYNKTGWLNAVKDAEDGRLWVGGTFMDDKYLKVSAYQYDKPTLNQMLITPGISDIGSKTLSFNAAMHHHAGDILQVMISTDFDGSDIGAATWVELSATLPGSAQSDYDWVASGSIDLSAYSGTGYVAFKYSGTTTETTGYHIDDVVIE